MKTLLFLILSAPMFAQYSNYIATATTTKFTLQQPATNAKTVVFPQGGRIGASVYCASADTLTLSWNGTAATATAGTIHAVPSTAIPASATVWTGSDVGSGTTAQTYAIAAAGTQNLDLGWFNMGANGTGNNITLATTGSCVMTFYWSEQ